MNENVEQKETEAAHPYTWEEIIEEFGNQPVKKLKLRNPERMTAEERVDEFIAITDMEVIPPELMANPKVRAAIKKRLSDLLGRAIDPMEIATSMPALVKEMLESGRKKDGTVQTSGR